MKEEIKKQRTTDFIQAESELNTSDFPLLNLILSNSQKAKTLLMLVTPDSVGEETVPEGYEMLAGYSSLELLIDDARKELEKLGFFSDVVDFPPDEECSGRYIQIFYSKSKSLIEAHRTTYSQGESAVGLSYGIPKTAIAAYPDKVLKTGDYPEYIKNHPLFDYLPFFLSSDHAEQEWSWFLEQLKLAKSKYPDLSREFQIPLV